MYLRIAPELYLKRLVVGGFERVYEINRNFRNEGISTQHNPEFTMLEFYWAWVDYETLIAFTEELFVHLEQKLLPGDGMRWRGERLDLQRPWRRLTVREAIAELGGVAAERLESGEAIAEELASRGVPLPPGGGYGHRLMALFESTAERQLVQPTFITDFPTEVSPLTRAHRDDPRLAERWDLVVFGMELGTAYTELIDPVEQRRRLTAQSLLAAGGDPEAMELDEDFLQALEYAMPPTGGLGVGVDRVVMLITGRSIRETLPFPLAKPR